MTDLMGLFTSSRVAVHSKWARGPSVADYCVGLFTRLSVVLTDSVGRAGASIILFIVAAMFKFYP